MLNIRAVLTEVLKDLKENPEAILVVDDQHIIDKLSGVEYHLYDDYFQVTRGDESPVSMSHFSPQESAVIMAIKDEISDPIVAVDKRENFQKYATQARERFSLWYENPEPVTTGVTEEPEEEVEEYVRR